MSTISPVGFNPSVAQVGVPAQPAAAAPAAPAPAAPDPVAPAAPADAFGGAVAPSGFAAGGLPSGEVAPSPSPESLWNGPDGTPSTMAQARQAEVDTAKLEMLVNDPAVQELNPTERKLFFKIAAKDPEKAEEFLLQQEMASLNELVTLLTTIHKQRHDMTMSIIANMR